MNIVLLFWGLFFVNPAHTQVGKATTFYPIEEGYNNGKFACGGVWEDPDAPVCAHRNLPCYSWVLVVNQKTSKTAWCQVRDRGPYGKLDASGEWFNAALDRKAAKRENRPPRKGRYRSILDMSRSVSRKLGSKGIVRVKVYYWNNRHIQRLASLLNEFEIQVQ